MTPAFKDQAVKTMAELQGTLQSQPNHRGSEGRVVRLPDMGEETGEFRDQPG